MSLHRSLEFILVSCVLFYNVHAGAYCGPNKIYACVPSQYCSNLHITKTNPAAYYNEQCFSFESCCDMNKIVFGKRYSSDGKYVSGPYDQSANTNEPPNNTDGKTSLINSQTPYNTGGKTSTTNSQTTYNTGGKTTTTNSQTYYNTGGKTFIQNSQTPNTPDRTIFTTHSQTLNNKNGKTTNIANTSGQTSLINSYLHNGHSHNRNNAGKTSTGNSGTAYIQNTYNHGNSGLIHQQNLKYGGSGANYNMGKTHSTVKPSTSNSYSPNNSGKTFTNQNLGSKSLTNLNINLNTQLDNLLQ
ncbi:probable ATP-dependent RNA helicase ddx42 [Drosophila ficusphila]|uniref:probable ATP-dependent RNA helicase ddx42 n=1 Tax=Drosophila ficusphila TaxID=30025 RepID=UPI0007E72DDF|nr:probable ATP-dependent RNA helicase ddx42 [Drosophila ficusphila]